MTFRVDFQAEHGSAELTHFENVDVEEIHASRLELAREANDQSARGAIINIRDSQITAPPAQIPARCAWGGRARFRGQPRRFWATGPPAQNQRADSGPPAALNLEHGRLGRRRSTRREPTVPLGRLPILTARADRTPGEVPRCPFAAPSSSCSALGSSRLVESSSLSAELHG